VFILAAPARLGKHYAVFRDLKQHEA